MEIKANVNVCSLIEQHISFDSASAASNRRSDSVNRSALLLASDINHGPYKSWSFGCAPDGIFCSFSIRYSSSFRNIYADIFIFQQASAIRKARLYATHWSQPFVPSLHFRLTRRRAFLSESSRPACPDPSGTSFPLRRIHTPQPAAPTRRRRRASPHLPRRGPARASYCGSLRPAPPGPVAYRGLLRLIAAARAR